MRMCAPCPWCATAITVAETAIRHHEARYRTPLERIAGWRYNPTVSTAPRVPKHGHVAATETRAPKSQAGRTSWQAYRHTYLWTVKTQYYFWRDYDKAMVCAGAAPVPAHIGTEC